jgi:hypothetical protein
MRLLLSNAGGGYDRFTLALPRDYNQSAQFFEGSNGTQLLALVRDHSLVVMRFSGDLSAPERRTLPLDEGLGSLVLEVADVNDDHVPDLLVGTTGRAAVPPTILMGPVWDHLDQLAGLLADPAAFGSRQRSGNNARPLGTQKPGKTGPAIQGSLPFRLPR